MGYKEVKNKLRRTATHLSRRVSGKPRIIAALTSYPPRIGTVDKAIRSLLAQRTLPDKIVLYLFQGDFPSKEKELPPQLKDLLANDVIVRWVDQDLKPHKKWYWAFKDHPDDLVVLFDDDLVYRNDLIKELILCHNHFPDCVCAARTHFVVVDEDGLLLPYDKWEFEAPSRYTELIFKPSDQLFMTTGAGTLFPPSPLSEKAFNIDMIRDLCLNADDVWLNEMLRLDGVKVVAATGRQELVYVPGTQEVALYHENLASGGNDGYFRKLSDALNGGKMEEFSSKYIDRDLGSINQQLLEKRRRV